MSQRTKDLLAVSAVIFWIAAFTFIGAFGGVDTLPTFPAGYESD